MNSILKDSDAKEFVSFFWHYFYHLNLPIHELDVVEIISDDNSEETLFKLSFGDKSITVDVDEQFI